jgi:4-amino-4-deoxy-L-arabinose transferase-like glycosyltransferase
VTSQARLWLALGVVAVAAFALRLTGTDWGKPYAYHFDEPFILKPALRIAESGDPNPHFFRYPSLMIYLETAIVEANHALGGMPLSVPDGPGYGPSDLGTWTWPALAGGRHAVAVIGTSTVVLAGAAAAATGGLAAGVAAALLLAFFPLHVEHSHYLTTDVPSAAFLALALWALLGVRRPLAAGAAAGAATGLAIATKYTAAAALPAIALLCLLVEASPSVRAMRVALMLVACAAAFLVACPYAVLDHGTFTAELNLVREHYQGGHVGAEGTANWSWYLRRLRDEGLGAAGFTLLAAGAAGVAYDAARALRSRAIDASPRGEGDSVRAYGAVYAAILSFLALAWFGWLGAVTVRFERNLMPIVVVACIAAGHGLGSVLDALGRRSRVARAVAAATLAAALVGPATMSWAAMRRLASRDTRSVALEWIEANVSPGSYIVREEYTPQPDPERYRVEYTWSLAFGDPRDYARIGVEYLVASQAVYARFVNEPSERYSDIVERYREIFLLPRAATFAPEEGTTGPIVTIYRVRHAKRRNR